MVRGGGQGERGGGCSVTSREPLQKIKLKKGKRDGTTSAGKLESSAVRSRKHDDGRKKKKKKLFLCFSLLKTKTQ